MTHSSVESTDAETIPAPLEALSSKPSRETPPESAPKPSPKDLYPVVWRWHFYAGLFTAPILWIITLTGAPFNMAWPCQLLSQDFLRPVTAV